MATVVRRSHPLVERLFIEMAEQGVTYEEMCERAGISEYALWSWRSTRSPLLVNIEAALNAVGLELEARPK